MKLKKFLQWLVWAVYKHRLVIFPIIVLVLIFQSLIFQFFIDAPAVFSWCFILGLAILIFLPFFTYFIVEKSKNYLVNIDKLRKYAKEHARFKGVFNDQTDFLIEDAKERCDGSRIRDWLKGQERLNELRSEVSNFKKLHQDLPEEIAKKEREIEAQNKALAQILMGFRRT